MANPLLLWFPCKLLKGVTIASGGVLPNIHPELLAKKRGSKGKLEAIITPPPAKKAKSPSQKKPVSKKTGGKKGARKSKVRGGVGMECRCMDCEGSAHCWGSCGRGLQELVPQGFTQP